jgi:hypothetical protein
VQRFGGDSEEAPEFIFRRSIRAKPPGELAVDSERRLPAPQPHVLRGDLGVARHPGMRAQDRKALRQAGRPMPFRTLKFLCGLVHAQALRIGRTGAHQRRAAVQSRWWLNPAQSLARVQSCQQTFGLSHQVVEIDAYSEHIGLAIRAARSSLSVSSMAPAG